MVGVVNGVGQEDIVAFVDQCSECGFDAEGGSGCREDFGCGIVAQSVIALELHGNRIAEAFFAEVVWIPRATGAHGFVASFDDVRRSGQVGLAAHQGHDVAALGLQGSHLRGNVVHGGGPEIRDSLGGSDRQGHYRGE